MWVQQEYELELMDYLRVFWWGKWIVVACFVLAVGIAAAVIWTKPPSYSVTGSYEVRETLSLYAPSLETPSLYVPPQETLSVYVPPKYVAILTKYAVQALPDLNTAGLQRSVSQRDPNLIDVSISGTASPKAVETTLASSIAGLEEGLVTQVEQALARERARAGTEFDQLTGQVAALRVRMAGETNEAVRVALGENVAALEMALAGVTVRRDGLGVLVAKELVSLREINRSTVVEVARNAKTTLAVAGFLGLFLGTLLAFFVHYLVTVARKDRAACGRA
jgi:uncharacterized protein involved in exopolysaccharide biosynthesis